MNPSLTFAILGGDRRMIYTAERFAAAGFCTKGYALMQTPPGVISANTLEEAVTGADIIVLPIPMSRDGATLFTVKAIPAIPISDILASAAPAALLLGGMTSAFSDSRLIDYGARADFAMRNAIPTAEGALLLAMQHLPCTVNGLSVGIVGFGKIGKATAALFRAAGASVTVFARREEVCTVAAHLGYGAAPLAELSEYAPDIRCLIGTVPAPVIGDAVLCRLPKHALILELASAPYGVDFDIASAQGIETVLGGGLPGKYAPEAAGDAIFQTALAILSENGFPAAPKIQ